MDVRRLRREEREALLELLDAWDVGDGWRGRDFFRRYLEDDPTYDDDNVWVAAEGSTLAACVQVFPRAIRIRGHEVPLGGIGTVFTDPAWRRRGLGETLLERAGSDMRARGFETSLLFPAPDRQAWYRRLGWESWTRRRLWVTGPGDPSATGAEPLDPARDLAGIRALHAAYSGRLDGVAPRDERLWTASLRNAGNPGEDFRVVREGGAVRAYARAIVLGGLPTVAEFGRAEGAADALARVLVSAIGDKALVPDLSHEPGLEDALRRRGMEVKAFEDPFAMLRCLDARALARRTGETVRPGETPNAYLRRLLPEARLRWWVADRF